MKTLKMRLVYFRESEILQCVIIIFKLFKVKDFFVFLFVTLIVTLYKDNITE
jgi:hypothetical protein